MKEKTQRLNDSEETLPLDIRLKNLRTINELVKLKPEYLSENSWSNFSDFDKSDDVWILFNDFNKTD